MPGCFYRERAATSRRLFGSRSRLSPSMMDELFFRFELAMRICSLIIFHICAIGIPTETLLLAYKRYTILRLAYRLGTAINNDY
jgi:hypothetical protein